MDLNNVPNDLGFRHMVGVTQQISEIDHFAPVDRWLGSLYGIWNGSRSLTYDLEKTFDCQPSGFFRDELLECGALHDTFDVRDGFQDISQSVFHGRRHSEDLDQIICDAFGDARLQQVPDGYLGLKAKMVFDQVQDLKVIEPWRFLTRGRLDQDVEIAVGAGVASRARSKQVKVRDSGSS
jgi:hypothetical protein